MNEIIEKIAKAGNKGAFLEQIVEDILSDLGFTGISRQTGGSQFGYDIVCYRGHQSAECWKIECKNLKGVLSVSDITAI